MPRNLKDMVVLITGASSGIGRTLAMELAARGTQLSLAARRRQRLEELNATLGSSHLVVQADVSSTRDCAHLVAQTLDRFGRIDTLVCNAGYGQYRRVQDFDSADLRAMFATNVFGTTDLIAAALPAMTKQDLRDGLRGQVVIVSSAAARRGVPYLGPYSATKAAQLSIAEAMRVELRPQRIAVTSVHPIMTSTEFGQVAEVGGIKLPRNNGPSQTVEQVVRAMVRAIERPRPEVWPHRPSRWALSLATFAPGLADRAMRRFYKAVQATNADRTLP